VRQNNPFSFALSNNNNKEQRGRSSVVGLDGPGIESQWGRDFLHLSRPRPGVHPDSCTMGTGPFLGERAAGAWRWPVTPFYCRWSWKSIDIPLLPLWAVRPVQSLSVCTRVTFTLLF